MGINYNEIVFGALIIVLFKKAIGAHVLPIRAN